MNNTRRDFLKKAGLIGAFVLVSPGRLLKASPSNSASIPALKSKFGDGFVFLFQGDSITDGNRGRNADPNHIMGHGYAFSIASRVGANHPEKHLTFYNRGISGNTVSDLAARWQKDCLDLKPNVLSILIGINDISHFIETKDNAFADKFEETYKSLLDQTQAQNPDILFVLCLPFILPVGRVKDRFEQYQTEVQKRQEVIKRLAKLYNALVVDFQQIMTNACKKAPSDYWMWDGIHPTVAGHELLTREWMRVVGRKLSFVD
jgi:lysophospholipase L1-like esterase